jgi:hypothetical protein
MLAQATEAPRPTRSQDLQAVWKPPYRIPMSISSDAASRIRGGFPNA